MCGMLHRSRRTSTDSRRPGSVTSPEVWASEAFARSASAAGTPGAMGGRVAGSASRDRAATGGGGTSRERAMVRRDYRPCGRRATFDRLGVLLDHRLFGAGTPRRCVTSMKEPFMRALQGALLLTLALASLPAGAE